MILILVFIILLIAGAFLRGKKITMYCRALDKTIVKRNGFSFTYYFFGCWVALFRGHISGFFITLLITFFTGGLGHFILAFIYNKMYFNWLVKQGYTIVIED